MLPQFVNSKPSCDQCGPKSQKSPNRTRPGTGLIKWFLNWVLNRVNFNASILQLPHGPYTTVSLDALTVTGIHISVIENVIFIVLNNFYMLKIEILPRISEPGRTRLNRVTLTSDPEPCLVGSSGFWTTLVVIIIILRDAVVADKHTFDWSLMNGITWRKMKMNKS